MFAKIIENLRNNSIFELKLISITAEESKRLSAVLKNNTSITSLSIVRSPDAFTNGALLIIICELIKERRLDTLDLQWNHLKNARIEIIIEALIGNTTLANLNLSHNNIRDKRAIALAKVLKTDTILKEFNLSNNNSGGTSLNEGAVALAQMLEVNTTLRF